MRIGYHGRSRDIRVRPTTSGRGWRIISTSHNHVGECFPNGHGAITLRLNGEYIKTEHPPKSLDGAARRLIGVIRRAVQTDRAKEPHQPRGRLKICQLCGRPRTCDPLGVCRRCDRQMLIDTINAYKEMLDDGDDVDDVMEPWRQWYREQAGDYKPEDEYFPPEPDDGGPAGEDIDWVEREVVNHESLAECDRMMLEDLEL